MNPVQSSSHVASTPSFSTLGRFEERFDMADRLVGGGVFVCVCLFGLFICTCAEALIKKKIGVDYDKFESP